MSLAVSVPQALVRIDRARVPQYLTRDQIAALISCCRRERDRMFIRVAWGCGARVSEILQLRRYDFDAANRQLRFETLKRRMDRRFKPRRAHRWIPVSDSLAADIGAYILAAPIGEGDFFFPFSRQQAFEIVRQAGRRLGLAARGGREISPHILRHSYAMNCIMQGVPINVVKELLGHSNIMSTMVYLKVDPREARVFLQKVEF